jgi:hypothetical protein
MNNKLVRKIIKEQLQNILMETPGQRVPLVRLDTGRIAPVNPENVKKYTTGPQATHRAPNKQELQQFQQQMAGDNQNPNDDPQQDPNVEPQDGEPVDDLEGHITTVGDETPSWADAEENQEATDIATNIGLVPSEDEGVYADTSGEKPIGVAVATGDEESPIAPTAGLPDELVDLVGDKIDVEMQSRTSADEEPEPEQEPETKEEDDAEVDTKEMDKFSKSVYGNKKGVVAGFNIKNGRPNSKPPSDAVARQTALETGFPKPPGKKVISPTTGEPAAPAPGNPGSMFNEILSIEGHTIAIEFEKKFKRAPTVSELGYIIDKQFGASVMTSQVKDSPAGEGGYKKKLRIAAEAAHRKNLRYKTALENNPDFGDVEDANQFYGAEDSLVGQAAIIAEMPAGAKVFGPQGEIKKINVSNRSRSELKEAVSALVKKEYKNNKGQFSDLINVSGPVSAPKFNDADVDAYVENMMSDPTNQENIRSFVTLMAMAGGGGANPSDTATFVKAKNGNVMVMWHSDKMERGDQQANSTLTKEANSQVETVENLIKSGTIDENQGHAAIKILTDFNQRVKELEDEDPSGHIAKTLMDFMGDKKKKASVMAAYEALDDKYKKEINSKQKDGLEGFLQMVIARDADPNKTVTNDEKKVFGYISKALEANSETSLSPDELGSVNSLQLGTQARQDVVASIHDRVNSLDKIETSQGPLGQILEAHNIINKLHLYALNDPSDLAYQSGMCETVIGSEGINAEVLREALGVNNTDELISQIRVGKPPTSEGDYTDPSTGMPEAMLQRSTNDYEKGPGGENMIWVTDDSGNIVGKAPEGSDLKPGQQFKVLKGTGKPVPVGVVTGQKSLLYIQTKDGKEFPISMQMVRSKSGATGKLGTAYVFSKEFQDEIKRLRKAGLIAEAMRRFLRKKKLVDTTVSDFKVTSLGSLSTIVEDIRENTPMELFLQEIENGIYIDE